MEGSWQRVSIRLTGVQTTAAALLCRQICLASWVTCDMSVIREREDGSGSPRVMQPLLDCNVCTSVLFFFALHVCWPHCACDMIISAHSLVAVQGRGQHQVGITQDNTNTLLCQQIRFMIINVPTEYLTSVHFIELSSRQTFLSVSSDLFKSHQRSGQMSPQTLFLNGLLLTLT